MFTKSNLKSRGWTDKLIAKFLKSADETRPNPYYKSGSPMLLYDESRIKRIERSKSFKTACASVQKFKEAQKKAQETKIANMMNYVNSVEINIPYYDKATLEYLACSAYDEFNYARSKKSAFECNNVKFLNRIIVNFLRHQCTSYDDQLETMFGKVGVQQGHDVLQKRINDKIYEMYDYLK